MHARSDFWYHIFFELGGSRLTESLSILDNPDLIMNKQVFTWLGKNDHEIAIRFLLLCEKLLDLPDIIEIRSFIDDFFLSNKGNCFDCLLQVFLLTFVLKGASQYLSYLKKTISKKTCRSMNLVSYIWYNITFVSTVPLPANIRMSTEGAMWSRCNRLTIPVIDRVWWLLFCPACGAFHTVHSIPPRIQS
jgi:hypothetical protein